MSDDSNRFDTATAKAAVLTEALPYILDFRGSDVLVKLGGSVMEYAKDIWHVEPVKFQ